MEEASESIDRLINNANEIGGEAEPFTTDDLWAYFGSNEVMIRYFIEHVIPAMRAGDLRKAALSHKMYHFSVSAFVSASIEIEGEVPPPGFRSPDTHDRRRALYDAAIATGASGAYCSRDTGMTLVRFESPAGLAGFALDLYRNLAEQLSGTEFVCPSRAGPCYGFIFRHSAAPADDLHPPR